jgi:hypothetical protein
MIQIPGNVDCRSFVLKKKNHRGNPEFCLLRFSKITSKGDAPQNSCVLEIRPLEYLL